MRFRSTVAAALGALALVVALPTSAGAATGEFTYTYTDHNGEPHVGRLIDPRSRECVKLDEVADPHRSPAHSPRNRTDATAVVFTDIHCKGDHFSLRPHGGHASERLKVRSVRFS
ncbi:hypothetical protein [Streptomyces sp. NPDC050485]|uniref:hypothetical protein n=1 Tax=Streptomyces sp. NPDC050485 TaxID=3365617 RepID=UPI00378D35E9